MHPIPSKVGSTAKMLKQIMLGYSDTEQYIYVLEAGRILRKIHSIPAPATQEDSKSCFILHCSVLSGYCNFCNNHFLIQLTGFKNLC